MSVLALIRKAIAEFLDREKKKKKRHSTNTKPNTSCGYWAASAASYAQTRFCVATRVNVTGRMMLDAIKLRPPSPL